MTSRAPVAEFLFSTDSSLELVEYFKLLRKISNFLMNRNESPIIFLHRYFNSNEDISSDLDRLSLAYKNKFMLLDEKRVEVFLKSLPYSNRFAPTTDYNKFIQNLIIFDVIKTLPTADDYIELSQIELDNFHGELGLTTDRYGLVLVPKDFELRPHGIIFNDKLLFYHPFLRRGLSPSGNFAGATHFLPRLTGSRNLEISVMLDPLRIGSKTDYKEVFEFDHWWGAPFKPERLNDPNYVGHVKYANTNPDRVYLDPQASDRTDFFISQQSPSEKVIQIEEIFSQLASPKHEYILQKYAHMIWSSTTHSFFHLDVAIKAYDRESYLQRYNSKWAGDDGERIRAFKKIKLFRVDGGIDLKTAMDLVSFFFYQNEQIHEFFEGKLE